ncbi:class I SAM-dependent methyltransferase [Bdellovibrionota bacterium FG-2]
MSSFQPMYSDEKFLRYYDIIRAQNTDFAVFKEDLSDECDVLDLGCGQGTLAMALAPHVRSIDGVDLAPEMIKLAAQKRDKAETRNVTFSVGDMFTFVPAKHYDRVILGNSVFSEVHGLESQILLLSKIRSCLKPSGKLLFTVVLLDNSMVGADYLKREITDPATQNKFTIHYENRLDLGASIWNADIVIKDLAVSEEYRVKYQANIYTRNEVLLLLKHTGFRLIREVGTTGWMKYFTCEKIEP